MMQLKEKTIFNHYKEHALRYWHKGLSVIPDKYGKKQPMFSGWSDYCYRLPTKEEVLSWSTQIGDSNIALCLGEASKVVALDIDTVDPQVLEIIMPILPESPVVKKGAKGETRFFQYSGETTDSVKHNGMMVIEILSSGKKTTLPPSLHPNGESYVWTGKSLLDVEIDTLPLLPPALFSHLQSKLKATLPSTIVEGYNKSFNGRNDALSSYLGTLIADRLPTDTIIKQLIEHDVNNHETPLFSDPEEMRHTEAYSNALNFYANHLASINAKRYRESKEYEVPTIKVNSPIKEVEAEGKSKGQVKRLSLESLLVPTAIRHIQSNILSNSWVKQPELSLGATLVLISTLISRKVVFQGMSPNLYILNIAPSGSGKDAPQQLIKKVLLDIGAESLLGAGDYVSDASLMDSLGVQPVRLDIMDEAGGILKSINSSKAEYSGKMADILAELYTCSNNKYLGRATADGTKGSCFRPNVNILASTTPKGFEEGVSLRAIEKGLLGRFLIFRGDPKQRAERLRSFPALPKTSEVMLRFWYSFNPQDWNPTDARLGTIPQNYVELGASSEAETLLDKVFKEFDDIRINMDTSNPLLPIVARMYQQMVKVVIISACARSVNVLPQIMPEDVLFGHSLILWYYQNMQEVVETHVHMSPHQKEKQMILSYIKGKGKVSKMELSRTFRELSKRHRDALIEDLIDSEEIVRDMNYVNGRSQVVLIAR